MFKILCRFKIPITLPTCSFTQDKWDFTENLNLIVENLGHRDVSHPRVHRLILVRDRLLERVVLIVKLWRSRWFELLENQPRLRRVVVFRGNELWLELHFQVGLVELEGGRI